MRASWRFGAFLASLAVILGAATWIAVTRDDRPSVAAPVVVGPMSIWPETPFDPPDALRDAQARFEAGHDPWRGRPDETVSHFVNDTFGWARFDIHGRSTSQETGPVTYRTRASCTGPCGDEGWVEVTVDRLLDERPGTVWSVVAVVSPGMPLPVDRGSSVEPGSTLQFPLSLAPDQHAAVGIRYWAGAAAGCDQAFTGSARLTGDASLTTPDPPYEDCDRDAGVGYVFAYSLPKLTVQTGDPMLEPVYLTGLSIVPVGVTSN